MEKLKLVPRSIDQIEDDVICELNNGWDSRASLVRRHGLSADRVLALQRAVDPEQKNRNVKISRGRPPIERPPKETAAPLLPTKPQSRLLQCALGLMFAVAGLVLGALGIILNWQFAGSLGQTPVASLLLATLGVVIDAAAILLPAAFFILLEKRFYGQAFLSVGMWALCFVLSLIAGMSFSSVNIGDSLQAREAITQRRQSLVLDLSSVQAERVKIVEERDPVIIEERIQLARGRTGSFVLKSSSDCRDITLPTSAQACSEVNELRASKRMAERRIELDNRSRVLSEQIAALPPIAVKDPGAEGMSRMTSGIIDPSTWENFRIVGYAIMPSLGGFLLAFARALFKA